MIELAVTVGVTGIEASALLGGLPGIAFKESGRCSKVDADGDKIFEEYEAEATGPNDTTPVKVKFVGGTGKYKGIKATLTSTFNPLPALSKTDTMGAAAYQGEYKIGD